MKILVTDPLSQESINILRQEGMEVETKYKLTPAELKDCIADYDILVVRSQTKVTKDLIDSAKSLKLVARAGVGVDNIDVDAATKCGVMVMNAPDANTISAAEHTFALLLAAARKIPQAHISLKQNKWERSQFMGNELYGKVLGIIGLGRIGREVAKRALAFAMHILVYDPYVTQECVKALNVNLVTLEQLLKNADYITIHTPLTSETHYMLSEKEFALMKDGVILVNCARGGIVDEKALYDALKNGKVRAAALDVFEKEPPLNSPLLELDNCITVPHLGASTYEAQESVGVQISKQLVDMIKHNRYHNIVNLPQVPPQLMEKIKPYLDLCERLGSMQAQLAKGRIKEVRIEYAGEILDGAIEILNIAFLKGLLTQILEETLVNYINAKFLAKERQIHLFCGKTSSSDYLNLITTKVTAEHSERSLAATIRQVEDKRIVKIDNFSVDAIPEGYLLILSQEDKPGIIGKVGTILGKQNINIGWLQLARRGPQQEALSVWNVDSEISSDTLDQIRQIEEVVEAEVVKL